MTVHEKKASFSLRPVVD